jgi:hypothetical protein
MSALPPGKLAMVPDHVETDDDDFVEIAPDATDGSARPCGKPGRSGPPGNKNARTHGMYSTETGRPGARSRRERRPFGARSGAA